MPFWYPSLLQLGPRLIDLLVAFSDQQPFDQKEKIRMSRLGYGNFTTLFPILRETLCDCSTTPPTKIRIEGCLSDSHLLEYPEKFPEFFWKEAIASQKIYDPPLADRRTYFPGTIISSTIFPNQLAKAENILVLYPEILFTIVEKLPTQENSEKSPPLGKRYGIAWSDFERAKSPFDYIAEKLVPHLIVESEVGEFSKLLHNLCYELSLKDRWKWYTFHKDILDRIARFACIAPRIQPQAPQILNTLKPQISLLFQQTALIGYYPTIQNQSWPAFPQLLDTLLKNAEPAQLSAEFLGFLILRYGFGIFTHYFNASEAVLKRAGEIGNLVLSAYKANPKLPWRELIQKIHQELSRDTTYSNCYSTATFAQPNFWLQQLQYAQSGTQHFENLSLLLAYSTTNWFLQCYVSRIIEYVTANIPVPHLESIWFPLLSILNENPAQKQSGQREAILRAWNNEKKRFTGYQNISQNFFEIVHLREVIAYLKYAQTVGMIFLKSYQYWNQKTPQGKIWQEDINISKILHQDMLMICQSLANLLPETLWPESVRYPSTIPTQVQQVVPTDQLWDILKQYFSMDQAHLLQLPFANPNQETQAHYQIYLLHTMTWIWSKITTHAEAATTFACKGNILDNCLNRLDHNIRWIHTGNLPNQVLWYQTKTFPVDSIFLFCLCRLIHGLNGDFSTRLFNPLADISLALWLLAQYSAKRKIEASAMIHAEKQKADSLCKVKLASAFLANAQAHPADENQQQAEICNELSVLEILWQTYTYWKFGNKSLGMNQDMSYYQFPQDVRETLQTMLLQFPHHPIFMAMKPYVEQENFTSWPHQNNKLYFLCSLLGFGGTARICKTIFQQNGQTTVGCIKLMIESDMAEEHLQILDSFYEIYKRSDRPGKLVTYYEKLKIKDIGPHPEHFASLSAENQDLKSLPNMLALAGIPMDMQERPAFVIEYVGKLPNWAINPAGENNAVGLPANPPGKQPAPDNPADEESAPKIGANRATDATNQKTSTAANQKTSTAPIANRPSLPPITATRAGLQANRVPAQIQTPATNQPATNPAEQIVQQPQHVILDPAPALNLANMATTKIGNARTYSFEEKYSLLLAIAEIIADYHAKLRIPHGDIKLSNFLIRGEPQLSIVPNTQIRTYDFDLVLIDAEFPSGVLNFESCAYWREGFGQSDPIHENMRARIAGNPEADKPEKWITHLYRDVFAYSMLAYEILMGHEFLTYSNWVSLDTVLIGNGSSISKITQITHPDIDSTLNLQIAQKLNQADINHKIEQSEYRAWRRYREDLLRQLLPIIDIVQVGNLYNLVRNPAQRYHGWQAKLLNLLQLYQQYESHEPQKIRTVLTSTEDTFKGSSQDAENTCLHAQQMVGQNAMSVWNTYNQQRSQVIRRIRQANWRDMRNIPTNPLQSLSDVFVACWDIVLSQQESPAQRHSLYRLDCRGYDACHSMFANFNNLLDVYRLNYRLHQVSNADAPQNNNASQNADVPFIYPMQLIVEILKKGLERVI